MKERPILFSTPMVIAIFNDVKTITRGTKLLGDLVIDEDSGYVFFNKHSVQLDIHNWQQEILKYCPYGQVGDLLWVRETFSHTKQLNIHPTDENYGYVFKANGTEWEDFEGWKWKPSIHMPKAAARIWLEITHIRVERLQDISESDAKKEGIAPLQMSAAQIAESGQLYFDYSKPKQLFSDGLPAFFSFNSLWCSINGPENWEANPFVWVIEFKKIQKPCRR